MSQPVYIVGAGGHGKVVFDTLRNMGRAVAGFLDAAPDKVGRNYMGTKVHDQETALKSISPADYQLANGIGSVSVRRRFYIEARAMGFAFPRIVHPAATVSDDANLAQGVQIMAGCVVQPGTRISENCLINTSASIDHDCDLGAHVFVGPGATLCGTVTVGTGSHVGTGATILEDLSIGEDATVGGGAMVVKSVPDGVTVVGVPAREVK
ncbi:MAG: sugar acetyltransferase [Rhodospirillaceae bacterium]|nr:sugar acetyltransferase [Rhodospirillaceae bacterium]